MRNVIEVIVSTVEREHYQTLESSRSADCWWSVSHADTEDELLALVLGSVGSPTVLFIDASKWAIYVLVPLLTRMLGVHGELSVVIFSKERNAWDLIWGKIHDRERILVCSEPLSPSLVEQLARFGLRRAAPTEDSSLLQRSDTGRLEAIGHLASGVAHELGTPVQYAMDSAYFIRQAWELVSPLVPSGQEDVQDGDLDYYQEEVPAALQRLVEGLSRVSELLASMRDLAPRQAAEELEVVDLNALVGRTLRVAEGTVKQRASLVLELGEIPSVGCKPGKIAGAILNLVINSAHAIEESKRSDGVVTVRTFERGPWVGVEVGDNGCGIPDENRSRIFDLFFTTKHAGSGTGQGLALVQAVVKGHEGKVCFTTSTTPGKSGSVFQIFLPKSQELREVS